MLISTKPEFLEFNEILQPQVVFGSIRDKKKKKQQLKKNTEIYSKMSHEVFQPTVALVYIHYWLTDHADLCNPNM